MSKGREVVEGSRRVLGVGRTARGLSRRRDAPGGERHKVARGRVVVLRVFVSDKARRQCGSWRGLNALVFGHRVEGGRRLFGREDRGVVRRCAATSPRPLRVADAQRLLCRRLVPHAVAMEELAAAVMKTRMTLVAAMVAGR